MTNMLKITLASAVMVAVENLKLNYPKREIIIRGDRDITIKADPSLFSIAISNLVENAFKYS
ncbi:MAG: sensor histidine kinase, partial [Sulfurimonas sp.]|nr:sensor histidine kinase [Sulfurimonas sp.]